MEPCKIHVDYGHLAVEQVQKISLVVFIGDDRRVKRCLGLRLKRIVIDTRQPLRCARLGRASSIWPKIAGRIVATSASCSTADLDRRLAYLRIVLFPIEPRQRDRAFVCAIVAGIVTRRHQHVAARNAKVGYKGLIRERLLLAALFRCCLGFLEVRAVLGESSSS